MAAERLGAEQAATATPPRSQARRDGKQTERLLRQRRLQNRPKGCDIETDSCSKDSAAAALARTAFGLAIAAGGLNSRTLK
jgi:hypothetical protein